MAKASSISATKLMSAVQDAVKAAVEKHPKLKVEPTNLSIGYLIWGFPVPENFSAFSVRETQAFAADVDLAHGRRRFDEEHWTLPGRGVVAAGACMDSGAGGGAD